MLVSVIIPTLNEAADIEACIAAAGRRYNDEEVEIIVADGGSTDGTSQIVSRHAKVVHSDRGRAVQMNRGTEESMGSVLIFCHADSLLPEGWREEVLSILKRPGISGGSFQTRFYPVKGLMRLVNRITTRANWRIMYGDQAIFMKRATFDAVGGYPAIPLMEDIEMARALNKAGRLKRSKLACLTSSRRFLERGPIRQYWLNFSCMIRYLMLGASPEAIVRVYRSSREAN